MQIWDLLFTNILLSNSIRNGAPSHLSRPSLLEFLSPTHPHQDRITRQRTARPGPARPGPARPGPAPHAFRKVNSWDARSCLLERTVHSLHSIGPQDQYGFTSGWPRHSQDLRHGTRTLGRNPPWPGTGLCMLTRISHGSHG